VPQNNPFILPGLGQTGEMAGNPMMASLEMMQQAWAGLAGPGGLTQTLPIPMNIEDLDRRIAELRTVENWLKLNLSMLSSTIQGMEVQRATIATLKTFAGAAPTGDAPSPLEVALGINKPASTPATPPGADHAADASATASATPADPGSATVAAAQSATQAWWNLMQQQFGHLASATASSMAGAATATSNTPAATAASTPPATAQTAAKRTAPRKRRAPVQSTKASSKTSA